MQGNHYLGEGIMKPPAECFWKGRPNLHDYCIGCNWHSRFGCGLNSIEVAKTESKIDNNQGKITERMPVKRGRGRPKSKIQKQEILDDDVVANYRSGMSTNQLMKYYKVGSQRMKRLLMDN